MKKYINLSIIVLILFSATFCKQDNSLILNDFSQYVTNTFTQNLNSGVDSIQTIKSEHPLIKKALESSYFKNSLNDFEYIEANSCIYFYNDGTAALLISNNLGNKVFAYIFKINNSEYIDSYASEINLRPIQMNNSASNEPLIKIVSLSTGLNLLEYSQNEVLEYSVGRFKVKETWGGCMKDAIKRLYDDWDNDAIGTFSCWVTGPLCVIGGGIACGIKQL